MCQEKNPSHLFLFHHLCSIRSSFLSHSLYGVQEKDVLSFFSTTMLSVS
uniref:Uncharacterized protein n=1 Tax=Rhizophora mucronata TaxID=61149 RepID=A0A2P2PTK7_RHIMU